MVWALILAIVLAFPTLAIAEPETLETGTAEQVQEVSEVEENVEEPDKGDTEPADPDTEPVSTVPVVTYSPTGELLTTTEAPEIIRAVNPTHTVYASVTSNTYSDMAARMLWKVPWNDDYVFWRSGQYSYTFAYGDFSLSGGRFDCASADIVTFQLDSGYSGTYTMHESSGAVSLVPSSYIVFSNLGGYPLLDPSYVFEVLVVFMASVAMLMNLVRSVFAFTYRMGVRVENEA